MPDPAALAATFCATLVDEWVRAGVRHAVIAPGSRSTPLALALTDRAELRVDVFHDERAASFAALGSGLATATPAVLLCTSGTAAAHFHGAVAEADLSGVPMLVCTADRPPELHDVGAAQTIDQDGLYGTAVRWFHAPGIADAATSGSWRSLAARAFVAATGRDPGPVHLNLAFREPLVGQPADLPPGRGGGAPWQQVVSPVAGAVDDADVARLVSMLDRQRGVIVAGAGCGAPAAVSALADATGWPVLADARSGVRSIDAAVTRFDALLRVESFATAHVPAVVLRLGEPPASKLLTQWIAASGAVEAHVSARPAVLDSDHHIAVRVTADPSAVCRRLAAALTGARGTPWPARWRHADAAAREATEAGFASGPLTEPAAAAAVVAGLPTGSTLVVSSSMPIRALEWFGPPRDDVRVLCNRGANGIDGVVATAIGAAAASGGPVGVLIGDVALLHDSTALVALAGRGLDVRIVVIDNDGGGIFSFLPQRTALDTTRFEQLFGTPHGADLLLLAAAHGLSATDASSVQDVTSFVAARGPSVLRVRLDRDANVAAYRSLNDSVAQALATRP